MFFFECFRRTVRFLDLVPTNKIFSYFIFSKLLPSPFCMMRRPLAYKYVFSSSISSSVVHLDVEDFSEELLWCLLCHKEPAPHI